MASSAAPFSVRALFGVAVLLAIRDILIDCEHCPASSPALSSARAMEDWLVSDFEWDPRALTTGDLPFCAPQPGLSCSEGVLGSSQARRNCWP